MSIEKKGRTEIPNEKKRGLALNRETLRRISDEDLKRVDGGNRPKGRTNNPPPPDTEPGGVGC